MTFEYGSDSFLGFSDMMDMDLKNSAFSDLESFKSDFLDELGSEDAMDYNDVAECGITIQKKCTLMNIGEDENSATNIMVDPYTLNQVSPHVDTQTSDATSTAAAPKEETVISFEEFVLDSELIATALAGAGIPATDGIEIQLVQAAEISSARSLVLGPANTKRKSSLLPRNIQEDAAPTPELLEAVEVIHKPIKRTKRIARDRKPKMHEMDPNAFPNAKGAVYSRMNRDKKKEELKHCKAEAARAQREVAFLRERLHARDLTISGIYGLAVVKALQEEDKKQHESLFGIQ